MCSRRPPQERRQGSRRGQAAAASVAARLKHETGRRESYRLRSTVTGPLRVETRTTTGSRPNRRVRGRPQRPSSVVEPHALTRQFHGEPPDEEISTPEL